jgi:hypothetical protein
MLYDLGSIDVGIVIGSGLMVAGLGLLMFIIFRPPRI